MATSEKLINIGSKHEDVQNRPDDRNVAINEVGICDLKIPLVLKGCEKDQSVTQHVQAVLSLSVDLDAAKKGIHMSRLLETALDHNKELSFASSLIAALEGGPNHNNNVLMRHFFFRRSQDASSRLGFHFFLSFLPVSSFFALE